MKKTIATASIAALLLVGLAGCTLELRDPSTASESSAPTDEANEPSGSNSSNFGSGACDDRDLVIDEEGSQLVLTGTCASVTITADNVAVNLETAGDVTVSGNYVTVLATDIGTANLSGTNIAINPDTIGSIEIGGEYNTLTTKSADSVSITGDYNIANWDEGAASATDTGTGNTVVAP